MSGFVVLGSVSSVQMCVIGWEERLQNDIFCIEWDVKGDMQRFFTKLMKK